MKRTTKIIIGIILSVFLLAIIFIVGFSFSDKVNGNRFNPGSISQENMMELGVKPYKTIWLDTDSSDITEEDILVFPQGNLFVTPAKEENGAPRISFPSALSELTEIVSSNDTLIIRLRMDKIRKVYVEASEEFKKHNGSRITGFLLPGFNFFAHTNNVDIISNLDDLKIEVKGIKTDTIKVNARSEVAMYDCTADVITPILRNSWRSFLLKDSRMKELNLDLDCLPNNWNVEDCEIDVENISGSGKKGMVFSNRKPRIVNWNPKNKDSQLDITFAGDTTQVVF